MFKYNKKNDWRSSTKMKQKLSIPSIFYCLIPLLILAGCSNPSTRSKITPTINITQARQTVETRLTQVAGTALVPSNPENPPTGATASPAITLIPTDQDNLTSPSPTVAQATTGPSTTANPVPTVNIACDRAAPGYPSIDVTIDDDTQMPTGKTFTKIWRLSNEGSCTWTKDYAAVWFSGEKLGETINVPLGRDVPPGESVEISVDMVAPMNAGTYQSNWKLRNAGGVLFGIGPNGDSPFWVRIAAIQMETSTYTPAPTQTPTLTATHEPTNEPTNQTTLTPTLTPTIAPPIQVYGSATLLPGETLDLDTTLKNTGDDDDLAYQENDAFHLILPLSGAVLGMYGSVQPTLEDCQFAAMSAAPIAAESLSTGTYLCYRTQQELPGWLRLNSFNTENFSIGFDFLTWAGP